MYLLELIKDKFSSFKNNQEPYGLKKLIYLGITFFFIIATYSVIRPLKTSVFLGMVGKEYQPYTKIITILILFPILSLYSKLVDKLRRYQVVYYFLGFYIVSISIFGILLTHPTLGLKNTATSPYRILGWIFYLLIDLYSPLAVSTFWAFANSISTTKYAKGNYGKIVAFSRIGGILTTIIGYKYVDKSIATQRTIPILLVSAAILLIFACLSIAKMVHEIPDDILHGDEAVYKIEKNKRNKKVGMWDGIKVFLTQPYVLGIFGLVYLYEAISVMLDYQMQFRMSEYTNNSVKMMTLFMFKYTAAFQFLGLLFSLFGTSMVLKKIGVMKSLFIMPISIILMMIGLMIWPNLTTIFVVMVILRALHYGFNAPVREILYIPTTKDIKFKSKAWIESFGRSLSKGSGSAFNILVKGLAQSKIIALNTIFIIMLSSIWILITIPIGKKYNKTIKDKAVIGDK